MSTSETMGTLYNLRNCLPITQPCGVWDTERLLKIATAHRHLPCPPFSCQGSPLADKASEGTEAFLIGSLGSAMLAPFPMLIVGTLECFSPTD